MPVIGRAFAERLLQEQKVLVGPGCAFGSGGVGRVRLSFAADDGRLRWKLATGGEITGSPVVKDGVVYACSKDRCVYALDAEKGTGTARTT